MNLFEVAHEIATRLSHIFLRDESGRRPVFGGSKKFQADPHWRDLILFYEYFHGDNGAGIGASHQTGWTGLIARIMHLFSFGGLERWLRHGVHATAGESPTPPAPPPATAPPNRDVRPAPPGRAPHPVGGAAPGDARARPGTMSPGARGTDPGPDVD